MSETTTHSEHEIKILITNIPSLLAKLKGFATYQKTRYIRDVIYGNELEKKKIRLRISDDFTHTTVEVTHKYHVSILDDVKQEIEDTLYSGSSMEQATDTIQSKGQFVEENSYEKIRILFTDQYNTEITLDIYPFGSLLEIEGEPQYIHLVAENLGYERKDYSHQNADELYLEWIETHHLPEQWDVRFGLTGSK